MSHLVIAKVWLASAGAAAVATGGAVVVANVDHSVALALIAQAPAIIAAVASVIAAISTTIGIWFMYHIKAQTDGLTTALIKKSVDAATGPAFVQGEQHGAEKAAEGAQTMKEVVKATVAELKKNGD
jgi:hypothetical protein